jgi:hypothetical protein
MDEPLQLTTMLSVSVHQSGTIHLGREREYTLVERERERQTETEIERETNPAHTSITI